MSPASADVIIDGSFTGTVYAVSTTASSPAGLSGLVGSTVTGSFSYDAQSLTFASGTATSSTWATTGSSNPVTMSASVGGQTYSVLATNSSNLVVNADETGNSNPANQFNLAAEGLLATAAPSAMLGSIDIVVANNALGDPYISSLTDPGTVSFSNQSLPASSGQGSSIDLINLAGQVIGAIDFAITDASAGPVASVPEPSTYVLLLGGLGLLGIVARRRKAIREKVELAV